MRLTTKFSAFVTLLTGLTIFVTLIGCSLSFYNAIQYKFTTRVQAVATAIDTHLVSRDVVALTPQIDELMVSVDIVRIELLQGEHVVYDHSRTSSYRPAGTNNLYREITVPLVKHPGMSLRLVYQDPMGNYFHSLLTTAHDSHCFHYSDALFVCALASAPAFGSGAAGDSFHTYSERRTWTERAGNGL